MDYCSMMSQEHAFVLGIEKLLNIANIHYSVNLIRILFDELTRILNHLLAIACHALDIGSMSSIFWAFEEREKLMEFYERVSGARMHAAFHKPMNLYSCELDNKFLEDILLFINNSYVTLNEMHNVLTYNKIWKQRLINIGSLNIQNVQNLNLSGVMSRSVGIKRDLRLSPTLVYSSYNTISFKSYFGINGDCYDRFLIRMLEMGESLYISNFIIEKLLKLNLNSATANSTIWKNMYINSDNIKTYTSMEDLINHFINWHSGLKISKNIELAYIEAPKGEYGVTLVSNNSTKPYKCKVKSPSYYNLQALPELSKGHYLADIAALIGTIDIVFGEVDR